MISKYLLMMMMMMLIVLHSEPLFESKCVPKSLSGGASSLLSGSGISSLANELGHDFAASQRELGLMGLTALLLSILMTIAFR